MKRHDTEYGRFYEYDHQDRTFISPSMTTFLKETDPKPFNRNRWKYSLIRKGISPTDAELYIPYYAVWKDIEISEAEEIVGEWIEGGMPPDVVDHFMPWKTKHSSERGDAFHDYIMKNVRPGDNFDIRSVPKPRNEVTAKLLESVRSCELIYKVKRIVGIETFLYYVGSDGRSYAGSEDLAYETVDGKLVTADWKSKDKKHYSQLDYADENVLQGVGYSGARSCRFGRRVDEVHIIYPFTDGSPAECKIVPAEEVAQKWKEVKTRLDIWWTTLSKYKPILNQ